MNTHIVAMVDYILDADMYDIDYCDDTLRGGKAISRC